MLCEFCNKKEAVFINHFEKHLNKPRKINICRGCHAKLHLPPNLLSLRPYLNPDNLSNP